MKETLLESAIAHLKNELATAKIAADQARDAATDDQSVAETQYDTLAIEASYLAHGQSVRYYELKEALDALTHFKPSTFSEDDEIQLGSLIELESSSDQIVLFIAPAAAGFKVKINNTDVSFVTSHAPIAQGIIGKYCGDEITIEIAGSTKHYEITKVS